MDKLIKNKPLVINFFSFLIFIILIFSITGHNPIIFPDSETYLRMSKLPIFDSNFINGERPITIPIIYKLFAGNIHFIIIFQKIFFALSIFILVFSIAKTIKSKTTNYIQTLLIYLCSLWWNFSGFSVTILSESVSYSLLFIWTGFLILLIFFRENKYLVLLIIVSFFLSFSRDTLSYLILCFFSLLAIFVFLFHLKKLRVKFFILFIFSIIIFSFQNYSSEKGLRYRIPLINNIFNRILTSEKNTEWFFKNGMPDAIIIQKFKDKWCSENDYEIFKDSIYSDFNNWILNHGKEIYLKFLFTHPDFVIKSLWEKKEILINPNIFYNNQKPLYRNFLIFLYPIFSYFFVILLLFTSLILFIYNKNFIYLLPFLLYLSFTFFSIAAFFGDANEIARHTTIGISFYQIIAILSLSYILDYIEVDFKKIINKIKNK